MKKILLVLLIVITVPVFGQTFYQDIADEDYKNLMKNGLSYVPTGDSKVDLVIEKAFQDEWHVSPYKIVNTTKGESLKEDDVQLKFLTEEGVPFPFILSIVSVKKLNKKGLSIYSTTPMANITGFTGVIDDKSLFYFVPYLIKAFNDMATKMNENKIEQRGATYFNTMNQLYIPNAKVLKEKTLLIVDQEPTLVNENELKKAGIKYEFVTFNRFVELESSAPKNYCLLYLNPSMYSDITIFNLDDKSIAYTRHYIKNVSKLDKEDIKLITSGWN